MGPHHHVIVLIMRLFYMTVRHGNKHSPSPKLLVGTVGYTKNGVPNDVKITMEFFMLYYEVFLA